MWNFFALILIIAPGVFLQETDKCKCVIYYLCDRESGEIINDGTGLVTERFKGCECNCPVENEVCCALKTNKTSSARAPPCGYSNPDGVGNKISTDSEEVNFGEFPWMIDILDSNGAFRCGGSLIHPSVVLTAAHCVSRKNTYIARAGEWNSSTTNEILRHQDILVGSVKIHENYYPSVPYNDIALLFLNGSFVLTSHIQPVCLSDHLPLLPAFGLPCYVAGRGKDESGQYKAIAKKIDLPLVDKASCQSTLRLQEALGQNFSLHESSLCAGGEQGKDACLGDGGASLFCRLDADRYQQVGIVSWGVGCHKAIPAVYTNVQVLKEWIDKQLKDRNLETRQYEI